MVDDPPDGTAVPEAGTQMPLGRGRARAAAGSLLFLVVAPGTMAVFVPYLLTGWEAADPSPAARVAGAALIAAGAAVLLDAFARFALQGLGTPSPTTPTERLVITGPNRYVRNPMYLAVAATILGQWLLLGRPVLLVWAAIFLATTYAFVRGRRRPAPQAAEAAPAETRIAVPA